MFEMAELGYELREVVFSEKKQILGMKYVKNDNLLNPIEALRLRPPTYQVFEQKLAQAISGYGEFYPLNSQPFYNPDDPKGDILTVKTINSLNGTTYNFVVLAGENFLRIGHQPHLKIGAGQSAWTAGEISFKFFHENKKELRLLVKSGNYQPDLESIAFAVKALWRQGIYPKVIKIYNWREDVWENENAPPDIKIQ